MTNRSVDEGTFKTQDGTELFYRSWSAAQNIKSDKALIVLHRGHEHSGRLHDIVEELNLPDFMAFGYDSRGHGKSPGLRGFAPDFSVLVDDLDTFVRYVHSTFCIPIENMVIVANSVAGVLTSTWVHDYAPNIRGMVLAAPAFEIKLYVPMALKALRALNLVKKPAFISSYVKPGLLTHDKKQADAYANDPLITPNIAVNILLDLHDTARRVVEDAGAIEVPTCIFSAGADHVVKNEPQQTFYQNLSSSNKELHLLPGFFHGVLFEKERAVPLSIAHNFIERLFDNPISNSNLLDADKRGYTQIEYDKLLCSPSAFGRINFGLQETAMHTIGKLSKGVRIGCKEGFDSGLSLDHVYKNKPQGTTLLGRAIDLAYLNAVGWKGIRQRKQHLQRSLDNAIANLQAQNQPVRIMDIAAGPGRYLIETVAARAGLDIQVLIRDNELNNINEGKRIAAQMGVKAVEFEIADAFDRNSYHQDRFCANILIVSGLYELFPQNNKIRASLAGATSMLAEDGVIIYTGQPWHPQLEMISRTLRNRDGDKWVMRRRTQREMDQLVADAGFVKESTQIDKWGIFTVSVAKKTTINPDRK